MLKTLFTILAAIAAAALMSVCPTPADARSAKGTGLSHEYPTSVDAVWKALPTVLAEISLSLPGERRSEACMLAQRGMAPFSHAENVAFFVESVSDAGRTRTEVVARKMMPTSVLAPDWSKRALDKLSETLK